MKIVLFRSVDNLGSAGDVVDVKRGYFRNYLGPRGYAKTADRASLALMESRRKKIDAMVRRERSAAGDMASALNGIELAFELRANDRGQLFGSITTIDIAKALADLGHPIDRKKIELPEHIKTLGRFPVRLRLYPEVYADVHVTVKRLLRPEEIEAMQEEEERKKREEERAREAAAAEARGEESGEFGDDESEA